VVQSYSNVWPLFLCSVWRRIHQGNWILTSKIVRGINKIYWYYLQRGSWTGQPFVWQARKVH
jgi:hypothetical protein